MMAKISRYADGGPIQDGDDAIVVRAGQNKRLKGSALKGSALNGWTAYSKVIPTRASADDPTYVLTFVGVDITSIIGVGMRLKWTQNSTVRYGIVHVISFSTNTTLTLYGGTDYNVDDTGTHVISDFYYSAEKAPLGFSLDYDKWSVEVNDTAARTQTSPVINTWYNLGAISIDIPIGLWKVSYSLYPYGILTIASTIQVAVTLSTTNNSESDTDYTRVFAGAPLTFLGQPISMKNKIDIAVKDTMYLNCTAKVFALTTLGNSNDTQTLVLKVTSLYL